MKYDKDLLIKDIENVSILYDYLNGIVWEKQEGQENHFDKLNKAEQIALIDIMNQVRNLSIALKNYKYWFND